ncbi:sphingomyelin phosphodiesterase 4 [Anthonomus grandis grandis]|uniref:sphingomyelin phosphodiesterase 4 n=1 Tax=Anthonomus grandis grandis TaxID=2921223 RepID=UPI0021660BD3|nr:sphingomyelin phosphodiesterase 4 [Anthonomus grandis grandis]
MYSKDYDNFMSRVQHALKRSVRARCAELTVLLDRASLLELHNFFPILIDNIFGPQGTVCWGLRNSTEMAGEDFRQLHYFLSPCGPVFRLIYALLKDPNIKYEFSLAYLPMKVRQALELPSVNPFYTELINISPQTKRITSLLLNPFDYYFFHFAYHLINPWQQRAGSSVTSWNTVYYTLCCDYILHFLPTDPAAKILPEIYYNGKNPQRQISPPASIQSSPRGRLGLSNPIPFGRDDTKTLNIHNYHPRNEIWRSETVLTVLTDMWMCNDSVNQTLSTSDLNNSIGTKSMRMHYNELPTGEYMRIVRVLIKQLHAFSDSAKADDTYLCALKKVALPMIQGKFYVFLRNLIHRWPLDGSFRLVLELWLTYIQPWRYPANNIIKQINKPLINPDIEDLNVGKEKQQLNPTPDHKNFIAENLLCYVVILEQLLPRFCRVDLVSPKMSLMLYRITKVFDQPNLPDYLKEIEACVENRQPSPSHKKYFDMPSDLPSASPIDNWSTTLPMSPIPVNNNRNFDFQQNNASMLSSTMIHLDKKWVNITRQKIFELEGPNFCYKPLFTQPPAPEVLELIGQIKKSIRQAQDLIGWQEQEEKKMYSGLWGSVKYFLQSHASNDEFTLDERRKVPVYLEVSLNNLRDLFQVDEGGVPEEPETSTISNGNGFEMSNDFKFLTPEKVRSRLKTIKYDGDPDLLPIRSDECTFLVRALYQFAQKVNENFGQTFYQLYHNPNYPGRLARQFLLPPMTVHKYDKSVVGSPNRVNIHLPPRVTFRHFASYRFLTYLLLGVFVAWLFNYRLDTYLFFVLFLFFVYKLIRAIPKDNPMDGSGIRHGYPTQGFGNISFNDSF